MNTTPLKMSEFFVLILTVCASCCLLGDWRPVADQRQRVRSDDGQEEALWVAGLDFGAIRPHGQRLFCVRNHHTISEYHPHMLMWLLELVQTSYTLSGSRFLCLFSSLFFFFAESRWRSWTFWTRCQRLKWAWPITLMENLYQVSPVGHSH